MRPSRILALKRPAVLMLLISNINPLDMPEGKYFHQGNCLADKIEKTYIEILPEAKFRAAFWTCDTMRQVSGRYEISGPNIIFIFAPPSNRRLTYRKEGRKIVPTNREKTFYGCGIPVECEAIRDYYLREK